MVFENFRRRNRKRSQRNSNLIMNNIFMSDFSLIYFNLRHLIYPTKIGKFIMK